VPVRDAGRAALWLGILFGLAAMGSSATAIALPVLGADLGLPAASTAWVLTGYALTLAVATAVHGRVADLVGIRLPLLVGVVMMAGGAVVAALSPSLPLLVAARLVQGAGAAAIPVLGTALVSARYSGTVRAAALARVTGVAAALSALGPLLGGVLAEAAGWRAVVAVPALGLLVLLPVVRAAPASGSGQRLDVRGALLTAATASGLVLLVQAPSAGRVAAVAGALLLALGVPLSVAHVRARPEGFLPRAVVGSGAVVRAALAAAAVPAAWFALLVAVPVVLAERGWTPLQVGLALVPSAVTGLLASRLSGRLLAALGARRALAASAAGAASALLLAALGAGAGQPLLLVLGVVAVTIAFGLGQPALVAAVDAAVHPSTRGVALGVATLVFLTGGAVGSAMVGGLGEVLSPAAALVLLVALPAAGAAGALTGRAA